MIRRRSLAFVALLGAFACSEAFAKTKPTPYNWIEARDVVRFPNNGATPPPLHPEDYEPYRKPGRSIVTGVLRVTLPDGTQVPCRFGLGHDEAFLIPDTLYTEWAVGRWTTLIDHRYFEGLGGGEFYPGDSDSRIPMPSYLGLGPGTIVGDAGCDEDGRFTFQNVPNGRYMVFGRAGLDHLVGSAGESRESAVTTPVGPVEVITEGHSSTRAVLGQQWTIVSVGSIDITQAGTYVVRSSNLRPAATFFEKN